MGLLLTHNHNPNQKIPGTLMKVICNFSVLYNDPLLLTHQKKIVFSPVYIAFGNKMSRAFFVNIAELKYCTQLELHCC